MAWNRHGASRRSYGDNIASDGARDGHVARADQRRGRPTRRGRELRARVAERVACPCVIARVRAAPSKSHDRRDRQPPSGGVTHRAGVPWAYSARPAALGVVALHAGGERGPRASSHATARAGYMTRPPLGLQSNRAGLAGQPNCGRRRQASTWQQRARRAVVRARCNTPEWHTATFSQATPTKASRAGRRRLSRPLIFVTRLCRRRLRSWE